MEEEAEKLKEMQGEVDQMLNTPSNKTCEFFCISFGSILEEFFVNAATISNYLRAIYGDFWTIDSQQMNGLLLLHCKIKPKNVNFVGDVRLLFANSMTEFFSKNHLIVAS